MEHNMKKYLFHFKLETYAYKYWEEKIKEI